MRHLPWVVCHASCVMHPGPFVPVLCIFYHAFSAMPPLSLVLYRAMRFMYPLPCVLCHAVTALVQDVINGVADAFRFADGGERRSLEEWQEEGRFSLFSFIILFCLSKITIDKIKRIMMLKMMKVMVVRGG